MADDRAYRIQVLFNAEKESYRALVPELELEVEADTRAEALEMVEAAIETKVEEVATAGETLARPVDAQAPAPGEVTLSLNGDLFRELNFHAQRAGLSPEDLALQVLAQGIGRLEGVRPQRKPRNAPADRPAREAQGKDEDRQPEHNDGRGRGRGRGGNQGGNRGRGGNQGGNRGRREGYRPEMDNQADFLAYVRDMEKGGGGRGRR